MPYTDINDGGGGGGGLSYTTPGTVNDIPKYDGSGFVDSQISDNGTTITFGGNAELGGTLNVNGNKIISSSNGNIDIEPHGTGNVLLGNFVFNADQTVGASEDNYVLTYDHGAGTIGLEASSGGGGGGITNSAGNNVLMKSDGTNAVASQISDDGTDINFGTSGTNDFSGSDLIFNTHASLPSRFAFSSATLNIQIQGTTTRFRISSGSVIAFEPFSVEGLGATDVPVSIEAAASQTANLLEINSNGGSGGDLFRIEDNGNLYVDGVANNELGFDHAGTFAGFRANSGSALWLRLANANIITFQNTQVTFNARIKANDNVFIEASASALADISTYGQLWVRDSDDALMYTEQDGTDHNLLSGGGGGITNSAGNNVIMKSDGTNAVASQISDNGTDVSFGTDGTNEFSGKSLRFNTHASNYGEIEAFSSSYFRFKMAGGTTKFQISNAAGVSSYMNHAFRITNNSATNVALEIELESSQTANAFEINSNSGSGGDLFRVESNGKLLVGSGAPDTIGIAGFADHLQIASGKIIYFGTSGTAYISGTQGTTGGITFGTNGSVNFAIKNTGQCFVVASDALIGFASTASVNLSSSIDAGLTRDSAGVLKVTDGSTGDGTLKIGDAHFLGTTSSSGAPTTTEYPNDKDFGFHEDTTLGQWVLAFNDGGTIRSGILI